MTIQTFIEKAIEGGWKPFEKDERVHKRVEVEEDGWVVFTTKVNVRRRNLAEILLDPEAWKAVGKVELWRTKAHTIKKVHFGNVCHCDTPYIAHMHRMIDALAEGKAIEQFLATLSPEEPK